jgi:hypothetical protein
MRLPATLYPLVCLGLLLSTNTAVEAAEKRAQRGFPAARPERGSFSRPGEGETTDLSPPGFS